jgi:hypothetical protein
MLCQQAVWPLACSRPIRVKRIADASIAKSMQQSAALTWLNESLYGFELWGHLKQCYDQSL